MGELGGHYAERNQLSPKRHFCSYEVPRLFRETESRTERARAERTGEGGYGLMRTEFQFGVMKIFWRWRVVMSAR